MTRLAPIVLAACMLASGAYAAATQDDYPNKPIRLVASDPGGAGDFAARLVAGGLTPSLGKQVIIDNRSGAFLSGAVVARATPDGYTLLMAASNLWLQPYMTPNVPWDPVKDFAPITLVTTSPLVVVLHPSVAASSVKELVALARAKPGSLNYGSGNNGSSSHLGPELFKSMAGVNIVRVPYKGAGPAATALLAGEVQMMIASAGSITPHVKSGKLKALAVTGARRTTLVPGLPTVAESGMPGYEFSQTLGLFAPAKTPARTIARLNQEIARVLQQPDVKQKLFSAGVEPVGNSAVEFAAFVKADMIKLGKVIKDAGIREE